MQKLLAPALLFLLSLPAVAAPRYHAADLGPIQLEDTFAINNRGQIVGSISYAPVGQGVKPAWLWTHGRRTVIKPQEGFACVTGCTLNDRGEVAGTWATTTDGATLVSQRRAFLWQKGRSQDIGAAMREQHTEAAGIDAGGRVVGWALSSDRPIEDDPSLTAPRAFVYAHAKTTYLGPGRAYAVNNRGQVACEDSSGEAVLWDHSRKHNLHCRFRATAINSTGAIAADIDPLGHAFLWQQGRLRELPRLSAEVQCRAAALNDAGDIVGTSGADEPGSRRALLWHRSHVYALNTFLPPHSGWVLETATGINARGQIVGAGRFHGKPHAYLLTPPRN